MGRRTQNFQSWRHRIWHQSSPCWLRWDWRCEPYCPSRVLRGLTAILLTYVALWAWAALFALQLCRRVFAWHMLVGQDVRFEDRRNTAVNNHRRHSDIDHGAGFTLEDSYSSFKTPTRNTPPIGGIALILAAARVQYINVLYCCGYKDQSTCFLKLAHTRVQTQFFT